MMKNLMSILFLIITVRNDGDNEKNNKTNAESCNEKEYHKEESKKDRQYDFKYFMNTKPINTSGKSNYFKGIYKTKDVKSKKSENDVIFGSKLLKKREKIEKMDDDKQKNNTSAKIKEKSRKLNFNYQNCDNNENKSCRKIKKKYKKNPKNILDVFFDSLKMVKENENTKNNSQRYKLSKNHLDDSKRSILQRKNHRILGKNQEQNKNESSQQENATSASNYQLDIDILQAMVKNVIPTKYKVIRDSKTENISNDKYKPIEATIFSNSADLRMKKNKYVNQQKEKLFTKETYEKTSKTASRSKNNKGKFNTIQGKCKKMKTSSLKTKKILNLKDSLELLHQFWEKIR
ncbi:hypothetical protein EDEG_00040 [Edhazardia aedis USNM 41457]|uniref:Uncharacterized protein n=1 Tax=Edhazardia aedis (strain USNM 41457) TaxID=1003232 RepID=J9D0N8_EDHAE|nr:hypothetical protein EDEG_00040 [Edhazardia aedis USNM 41457]|eukprot:EJW01446.1 hypothetical protein EDEG_00040 [Edhazardia aedis USNM 41457]